MQKRNIKINSVLKGLKLTDNFKMQMLCVYLVTYNWLFRVLKDVLLVGVLNQIHNGYRPEHTWFLKYKVGTCVCVCVCVCVRACVRVHMSRHLSLRMLLSFYKYIKYWRKKLLLEKTSVSNGLKLANLLQHCYN